MIRLIDIVLILLFGFISISHFDRAVEVDLPNAGHLPRLQAEFQDLAVVSILGDGTFICGMDRRRVADSEALAGWLAAERDAGAKIVRLRADRSRPSSEVAMLQQICGELGMGLTLEIVRRQEEITP